MLIQNGASVTVSKFLLVRELSAYRGYVFINAIQLFLSFCYLFVDVGALIPSRHQCCFAIIQLIANLRERFSIQSYFIYNRFNAKLVSSPFVATEEGAVLLGAYCLHIW